jgi:hypothetical protein
MGGVGIDPQPRVGQVVGEELRVDGRDHHVVVAVGDERGMCDPGKPAELGRVWDAPFDDRVVLSACDLRTIWLAAPSSRLKARCTYSRPSPAGLGDLEEDLKQLRCSRCSPCAQCRRSSRASAGLRGGRSPPGRCVDRCECVQAFRPGLVSSTTGSCKPPLSAYRILGWWP